MRWLMVAALWPVWIALQAASILGLWLWRLCCPHPPRRDIAGVVIGGLGTPIYVRRCGRCGAEVGI